MDKDIFNDRYTYLAYPIGRRHITSQKLDIFEKGMRLSNKDISDYNIIGANSIDYQRWLENLEDDDFVEEKYIKSSVRYGDTIFCIARIPTCYLVGAYDEETQEHNCLPILKAPSAYDFKYHSCSYIIPELIYGIYDASERKFIPNDNYDVFYDPNGLQYTDSQVVNVSDIYKNPDRAISKCLYRRAYDYDRQKLRDQLNNTFGRTIEFYQGLVQEGKILKKPIPSFRLANKWYSEFIYY